LVREADVEPCPTCQTEVTTAGARWCGRCGAPLRTDLVSLVALGGDAAPLGAAGRPGPVGSSAARVEDGVFVSAGAPAPHPGPRWIAPAWAAAVLALVAVVLALPDGQGGGAGDVRATSLGEVDLDADGGRDAGGSASGPVTSPSVEVPPAAAVGAGGPAALDPGPAAWSVGLPAPAVEVVLGDDRVVAATGASVHAFTLAAGDDVWERRLGDGTIRSLHLAGDVVLAVRPDTGLVAMDLANGGTLWSREAPVQSATVAGDAVVIGDGQHVEALGLADGQRRWRRDVAGFVATGTPGEVLGVVGDDRLIGLDVADGRTRWTLRLQPRGGAHQTSDLLVVSSRLGLRVVDVRTGRTVGTAHEERDLGGRVRGQARVLDDDRVVAAVGDGMVALDAEATALWRAETGDGAWLLAETGVVATVESGARVVLLDPETGADVLRTTPSGWFTALAVGEDRLALAVHTPRHGRLQVHDIHSLH
jgi:outer membrane protein assembly factor BamB